MKHPSYMKCSSKSFTMKWRAPSASHEKKTEWTEKNRDWYLMENKTENKNALNQVYNAVINIK